MKRSILMLMAHLLVSAAALAAEPNPHDPALADAVSQMRQRQEQEEGSVIRVIQQPVMLQMQQVCSPVEQARQRIKDVGGKEGKSIGTVTVEAGHGEVAIDSNSGTVDNSVSVQVVNPNERSCL